MEKEKTRFGKSGSIDFEEINKRMNKFIEEGDRKNLLDLNKNIKNKNCFVLLKEDERIKLENALNTTLEMIKYTSEEKIEKKPNSKDVEFFLNENFLIDKDSKSNELSINKNIVNFTELQKRIDKFIEEGDRKRLVNLNYDLKNKDRNFPGLNEKEKYQLESIIDTSLEVASSLQKKKIRSNIPNYEELKERINNFHQEKKNTDLKALRAHLEKKDSFIQLEKEQKDELISLINEFQPRKMETKMGKKNIDDLREEIKNAIEEKNAKKLANFKTCLNTKSKYPDIKQTDKEVLIEEIKKCDFVTEYVSNYHKQLNQRKKTEKEEEKFSLKDIKSEVQKSNF